MTQILDFTIGVMLYLEIQEGKERMARQKYVGEYQATSACTLRMLAALSIGENSLAPNNKLQRVIFGDSWFASLETLTALREKLGLHFVGVIKTAHKGYPLEMCRWALVDEDRGKYVVFKHVDLENVWAIGWSDIHFKTFICTQGVSSYGDAAEKKRQRADGRNYKIQVDRPRVIGDYQKNMEYVDRHNRFRQNILGLAKLWRTKKWQVRVILEVFGMALVDSFLLARKFIPRWQQADDSDGVFWRYVTALLPQLANEYGGGGPTRSLLKCEQVLIGKTKVEKGTNAGRVVAKQMRCVYCSKSNKSRKKNQEDTASSDSGTPTRARRTAYTCICHREAFSCKEGLGGCWDQHLTEYGSTQANTASSDDEEWVGSDSD